MPFTIQYLVDDEKHINNIEEFLHEWRDSSLYINTYTSGSTGQPKLISIKKEYMIQSAKMTGELLAIKKGDNALLNLSIETIAGKMMVVRSLVLGLNLFIVETNNNPFLSDYKLPKIDFIALVPLQVSNILKANLADLKNIRNIIIGGANVSNEIIELLKLNEIQAFQTFGMTETISHFALKKIGKITEPFYSTNKNITISINKQNNTLIVNAPKIGVIDLNSTDIIELINEHQFKWIGRSDYIINSGGIKINPEEIESKISKFIPKPFFIYGIKDELLGEKLVLFIESEKSILINEEYKNSLPTKYYMPKEIIYLNQFIRTNSNKINRKKTVEEFKLK